jgi:hypothetical protein
LVRYRFSLILAFLLFLTCGSAQAQTGCSNELIPAGGIPARTVLLNPAQSLVGDLVYEFLDPVRTDNRVATTLALDLTMQQDGCDQILYPLGLRFQGATFLVDNVQAITLSTSVGIANLSFDPERLEATLAIVLPLPKGFRYQATLTRMPTSIDDIPLTISVVAPGDFGTILQGDWKPDRHKPDFGLRSLAAALGIQESLDAGQKASLEILDRVFRVRLGAVLNAKSTDVGAVRLNNFQVDWDRWDRGDQVLSADVEWIGTDTELAAVLPSAAEFRIAPDGRPQVRLSNLNTDKLKGYLSTRMSQLVDLASLEKMIHRWGGKTLQDLPLGWLRLRNVSISETRLTAEVAFAIDDEPSQWVGLEADLPSNGAAFAKVSEAIAQAARESLKKYATKTVEQTLYAQVADFVSKNANRTFTVFGIPVSIALVPPTDTELPPKPIAVLSSPALGVVISNVGLLVEDGRPIFDWKAATFSGLDRLADELLRQSSLSAGDLSLRISGLKLADGRLEGELAGVFLGTPFSAPVVVSENDVRFSLPNLRQEMITAIQKTISGRRVEFAGLTLSDVQLCPDGATGGFCKNGDIVTSADVKIADLFEGTVTLKIYPSIRIENLMVKETGAFGGITGIFRTGPVEFDALTQFSPVVITGKIKMDALFDVIAIPDIPFRYSTANGKLELTSPNEIVIPTDVPIPPWLNLSQVRIPIKKREDGQVQVTTRITVGQSAVQYLFNIDGTLTANPEAQKVSIAGKASLVSVPLYTVDGSIDFKAKEGVAKSTTAGFLDDIIHQSSEIRISGADCLVSQDQDLSFLFFKASGSLLIQVPPSLCNSPLPQKTSSCGLTSAGGVCLKAAASAGALGNAEASFTGGFDLKLSVAMETELRLILPVKLKIAASERQLRISARVPNIAKFGFVIKNPNRGTDAIARDIINGIVDALKQPNLKLPLNFEISGGAKGSVDVSGDDGSDANAEANELSSDGGAAVKVEQKVADNSNSGGSSQPEEPTEGGQIGQVKPVEDKNPTQGTDPKSQPAGTLPQVTPAADQQAGSAKTEGQPGTSSSIGILGKTGPIRISFDGGRHIVATNTETGNVSTSSQAVSPEVVALYGSECFGWVGWATGPGNPNYPSRAVDAGAMIFGTRPKCGNPVPYCETGRLCAINLADGHVKSAMLDLTKFDWSGARTLVESPAKATDLEDAIIRGTARQQLYSEDDRGPTVSEWRCAVLENEVCQIAVGWDDQGKPVSFVDRSGVTFEISQGSLIEWAASSTPDLAASLLTKSVESSLFVMAETDDAWLVSEHESGKADATDALTMRTRENKLVSVTALRLDEYSRERPWQTGNTSGLMNDAVEVMESSLEETDWAIDFLGDVSGGERLLLMSDVNAYLITRTLDESCRRRASRQAISGQAELSLAKGNTLMSKLGDVLSLESSDWRQRGFRRNPVFGLFGNACN